MGTLARQHDVMLALLLDEELRERFFSDRDEVIADLQLDAEDAAVFADVTRFGLDLDAGIRCGYLMSALCRPYPLTAAALGTTPQGRRALTAFLTSPAVRAELGERTAVFGDHLSRLLELDALGLPREVTLLIHSILTLERARVDVAASVRRAVEEEGDAGAPRPTGKPTASQLKRGRVTLPPFFIASELPMPMGVVETALDHVGAHDAWQRIESGQLSLGRVTAVARALPMPVTVISRTIARGTTFERTGAGGISPLVDVRHLVAELRGKQRALFDAFDGRHRLSELSPVERRLARPLLEQGLLVLVDDR